MKTLAPRLFTISWKHTPTLDCDLTDLSSHKRRTALVADLRPASPFPVEAAAFDCALALYTLAEVNGSSINSDNIEQSLTDNLERLSPQDLLATANYLYDFSSWQWDDSYERYISIPFPDLEERLLPDTLQRLVNVGLRSLVDKYTDLLERPLSSLFLNVSDEVVTALLYLFRTVRHQVRSDSGDALLLDRALDYLNAHPNVPPTGCVVTLTHEDATYTLVYTSQRFELSDYHSVFHDAGSDHFQRFCFRYEQSGEVETQGDLDEYITSFRQALRAGGRVSISDKE